jgi:hypothetical protein
LKKVPKLRVYLRREGLFKAFDSFGDFPEPFHVTLRILATGFIGDNGKAFAKRGGELS